MSEHGAPEITGEKLRCARLEGGALLRVSLNAPKGNVLDSAMTAELTDLFRGICDEPRVKAVLLTAEGPHFSFGASVEEHRPEQVRDMLTGFHGLFRAIAAARVPVVAAVRGVCLGGGLELVSFCHRIFAHPESSFGQPEITLGVFAPVGSAILAERVGRGAADDLLLTGRTVKADEALAMRLVDAVVETPEATAMAWIEECLLPRSASSLRFATHAARLGFLTRFERDIEELERVYLGELMATKDASEGIEAFLGKRKPAWSDA